jgi:hypothetical protein
MGDVTVAMNVFMRDESGRFAERIDRAGEEMMAKLAEVGADTAIELAPEGEKRDPRTTKLKDSITHSHTATSAHWEVNARHANIIEKGSDVRPQMAGGTWDETRKKWVAPPAFFWAKEGRFWNPGGNTIDHPPTPAQPYMQPSFEVVMELWQDYAIRYYPQ